MFGASDDDIIQWANAQVVAECGNPGLASRLAIKSFSDPSLSSGVFLMHLLNSLRGIVDWSHVSNGLTESEKLRDFRSCSGFRVGYHETFCGWFSDSHQKCQRKQPNSFQRSDQVWLYSTFCHAYKYSPNDKSCLTTRRNLVDEFAAQAAYLTSSSCKKKYLAKIAWDLLAARTWVNCHGA
jgi:hypothetical protein